MLASTIIIFASTIRSFIHFGFWGGIIRASVILLCAGSVLLIVWRKKHNMFCKTCRKRVGISDVHCKSCGSQMTDDNTEIIIGVGKKSRIISVLSIAVLIGTLGLSVVAFATSYNFSEYATGMYSELHQTYTQNDRIWGIECKSALTEGTFNKTIAVDGSALTVLTIESSCDVGTLILNVKQGDRVESIDISNTKGEFKYNLASFDDNSDIKLIVEHNTAKNIEFGISWE